MFRMPTYVAFLRAINLGATRKFPKDAIRAAAEEAGFTDVATYINTGNVRVTTPLRSRAKVEAALEEAFLADRGFEVPTMVLTLRELLDVAEVADDLAAEHPDAEAHYVTLLKEVPAGGLVTEVESQSVDGELCRVTGRAAHVVLLKPFRAGRLMNGKAFAALGVGTARNVTVIRTLADKWGP
jgi:uncharacterized protein (DUF1697 family)